MVPIGRPFHERVELVVLSRDVDALRRDVQEVLVVATAGEFGLKDARIDRADPGRHAGVQHLLGVFPGIASPQEKDGLHPGPSDPQRQTLPQLGRRDIGERHELHAFGPSGAQGLLIEGFASCLRSGQVRRLSCRRRLLPGRPHQRRALHVSRPSFGSGYPVGPVRGLGPDTSTSSNEAPRGQERELQRHAPSRETSSPFSRHPDRERRCRPRCA